MYDCIIIGAGPAGIEAGLFLGRATVKTLLIGAAEKSDLAYGKMIGNYFGFSEEPSGMTLLRNGLAQLGRYGVEVLTDEVVDLAQKGDGWLATTATLAEHRARAVIIASGRQIPTAGIRGERDYLGKGVHTCVACDGPLFKGKKAAVVGSGPHAAAEAVELADFAGSVRLYSQGEPWSFNDKFRQRLAAAGVTLVEKRIVAVEGDALVRSVSLADQTSEAVDGVFIATGSAGGITFANKIGLILKDNFLVIDRDGRTNVLGIWAVGGVTGGNQQIAKSVGEGCNAAISVIKTLKGLETYADQT